MQKEGKNGINQDQVSGASHIFFCAAGHSRERFRPLRMLLDFYSRTQLREIISLAAKSELIKT
jgi:hypothetical protein